ncbi:MAG TPA: glycosyltransferase family 39 protein [bacterium]|nr:glycosyltransferase family 39 protein [bacterium]
MSRRRASWLLALIVSVQVGASVFWIAYDRRPPCGQDCVRHTLDAVRILPQTSRFTAGLINIIDRYLDAYPPAHRSVVGSLFRIFGVDKRLALGTSALCFAALILVVYAISRSLVQESASPALLAAFLVGCFPAVFAASHFDNLSMMLTLGVALSVLCLIRTDGFRGAGWSAALGLSLGLGLLIKWTFFVFLVGPLALTIASRARQGIMSKRLRNLGIAIAFALLIALPWYAKHLEDVLSLFRLNKDIYTGIYPSHPFNLFSLGFYIIRFIGGMTPVLSGVVVLGFVVLLIKRRLNRVAIPLGWVMGAFAIMLFFYPKWPRYMLPAYPALAIVAGHGICSLKPSTGRSVLITLIIVLGLIMLLQGAIPHDVIATTFRSSFFEHLVTPLFPTRDDWQIPRIVRTIAADWGRPSELCSVAVAPKLPALQAIYCNFETIMNQRKRILFKTLSSDNFFWYLVDSDYIVTRTGPFLTLSWEAEASPWVPADRQVQLLEKLLADPPKLLSQHYQLVARFNGSDDQTITISRRTSKFTRDEQVELLELLSPIFRKPEEKEIALRIIYRRRGWFGRSRKLWEKLEDEGLNRSWLDTERGPDLVDVLEAEDMVHNFRAGIFAGRRVHGGWEILRPSEQLAPVLLPEGQASLTLVAQAKPKGGEWPTIQVALDGKVLWQGKITSEEPSLYRFEAQTQKRSGMLCIKMLAPRGSEERDGSSVVLDKVIIRRASNPSGQRHRPPAEG